MQMSSQAINAVKNPTRGVSQQMKGGNNNNNLSYWQVKDIETQIRKEKKERKAKAMEYARLRKEEFDKENQLAAQEAVRKKLPNQDLYNFAGATPPDTQTTLIAISAHVVAALANSLNDDIHP